MGLRSRHAVSKHHSPDSPQEAGEGMSIQEQGDDSDWEGVLTPCRAGCWHCRSIPERIPHPAGNCGQVLPSSRCFPLALAQVWHGVVINGPGQEREAVCGVFGDSLGHPLLLQLYVAWHFISPSLAERFKAEKSEWRLCVLFFSMCFLVLWE